MATNSQNKSSEAWLLLGLTGSQHGTLRLSDGNLSFEDDQRQFVFSAPLAKVANIKSPWYALGAALDLNVDGQKYRLSFMRPHTEDIDHDALQIGKSWKDLLSGG